jgi:hypothetical protein
VLPHQRLPATKSIDRTSFPACHAGGTGTRDARMAVLDAGPGQWPEFVMAGSILIGFKNR